MESDVLSTEEATMDHIIEFLRQYAKDNEYRIKIFRADNLNHSDSVFLSRGQTTILIRLTKVKGRVT